jgi:hypothetical protein
MSTAPNTQSTEYATRISTEAFARKDYTASNVAWAIKVQLMYGRAWVRNVLARLSEQEICALVEQHRHTGTSLGAAWWAVQRYCFFSAHQEQGGGVQPQRVA